MGLLTKILKDKFDYPDMDLLYCAPTYQLIRDIAYRALEEMLNKMPVTWRLNRSENVLYIAGFGRILFRTMDRPELMIGFSVFRAYLDELDTLKTNNANTFWNKVIARCRQKPKSRPGLNQVFVATTPEGYKFVYEKFYRNPLPGSRLIRASTRSNPYLPEGYVESLINTYDPRLVAAYIDGEFVNLVGKQVYYAFDRDTCHTDKKSNYGENTVLHVGIDFNVHNMAMAIGEFFGKELDITADMHGLRDTVDSVNYIEDAYVNMRSPRRVIFYPDATGRGKSAVAGSFSNIHIIKNRGHAIVMNPANPPVSERIATVNQAFKDGLLKVNTRVAAHLTEALEQQVYRTSSGGELYPDKTQDFDHILDGLGYMVYHLLPINKIPISQIRLTGA